MNDKLAMFIFININDKDFTDEEKVMAIYRVLQMPTHNSITKSDMLKALNWLWHSAYEIEENVVEMAGDTE